MCQDDTLRRAKEAKPGARGTLGFFFFYHIASARSVFEVVGMPRRPAAHCRLAPPWLLRCSAGPQFAVGLPPTMAMVKYLRSDCRTAECQASGVWSRKFIELHLLLAEACFLCCGSPVTLRPFPTVLILGLYPTVGQGLLYGDFLHISPVCVVVFDRLASLEE